MLVVTEVVDDVVAVAVGAALLLLPPPEEEEEEGAVVVLVVIMVGEGKVVVEVLLLLLLMMILPRLANNAVGTSIPWLVTKIVNQYVHLDSSLSYERKEPDLVYTTTSVPAAAFVVESSSIKLISRPYNTTPPASLVLLLLPRALRSNMNPEVDDVELFISVEIV